MQLTVFYGLAAITAVLLTLGHRCDAVSLNASSSPSFLKWISHDGCTVFVWRGGSDDRQLWLEPTFCVLEPKRWLGDSPDGARCPSYDPVKKHSYVSVPVMLTNKTFLDRVAKRLAYLKPSSVRYLSVRNLEVKEKVKGQQRTGRSKQKLRFEPLSLSWSQSEANGLLKFKCIGVGCSVLYRKLGESAWELLDPLMAVASLTLPEGETPMKAVSRAVVFQNAAHYPISDLEASPDDVVSPCKEVGAEEVIDVTVGNGSCRLRLHRMAGRVFAEPLLCYSGELRVAHDFNRGVRSLWLTLLLRSETAVSGARVGGRNVTYMRLVDPRPEISDDLGEPEMRLGSDGNSMLIRLECGDEVECEELRSAVKSDPLIFFTRIKWHPLARIDWLAPEGCRFDTSDSRMSVPLEAPRAADRCHATSAIIPPAPSSRHPCGAVRCQFVRLADGREFLLVQQRSSASVRFERNWTDYEIGFGDEHNFWIGLKNIASLTHPSGSLMRIEAKLWNGTELYAEYSGVRLTGRRYNLTYERYLRERSNTGAINLLVSNNPTPFTTRDSEQPAWTVWQPNRGQQHYYSYNPYYIDVLRVFGYAGWWWHSNATQANFNPNGVFHYGDAAPVSRDKESFVGMNVTIGGSECATKTEWTTLMLVRIMLEV